MATAPVKDSNENTIGYMVDGTLVTSNDSQYTKVDSSALSKNTIYSSEVQKIKSARYPLAGTGSHFVRFYINLNEESKLIADNVIGTTGYVDNTQQNRANRDDVSIDALRTAGQVAGTVAGAKVGANLGSAVGGAVGGLGGVKGRFLGKAAGLAIGGIAGAYFGGEAGGEIAEILAEKFSLTKKLKRLEAGITLYTPGNVRASYTFKYDMPEDLLVTLAQSENFESIKSGLESMKSAITGEGAAEAVKNLGAFGRIIATGVSGANGSKTVSMLSRTAINSRRDVVFQYVGNRQFRFEYTFAPRDIKEAEEVDRIIFMFKYFAHPEVLQGYSQFLYLYPAEFDIEYGMRVDGGQEIANPNVNKISSCVLDSVDVDYSPTGRFQTLEKGEPVIIKMSLMFREIETLHRARIAKGY
jgi:hypothetical protein